MSRRRHTTQYPGIRYRLVDEERPGSARRYIVDYYDANGTQRSETLPLGSSLEDARLRKAKLEGVRRTFVPAVLDVGQLMDSYLEQRRPDLKPKTVEDYEYGIRVTKDHMGYKRIQNLSPNDCAAFLQKLRRSGLKTSTIKKILTPLVGALKVAVREGWIQSSPLDSLLPHERLRSDTRTMRCLSSDEIDPLLAHASSERWRVLFATLIFSGLRIGEALALTWDDVTREGIRVRESKTEAGKRTVMMPPFLHTALARMSLSQPPLVDVVFANRHGRPVGRREALRALRAAERRAGLPDYTLHELRHTYASILISQGETPVLVAHQMGHANPAITLSTYSHLFDEQENVERATARLQSSFGGMI